MKIRTIIFVSYLFIALCCNETTTSPSPDGNFLINSSFDKFGSPSLYGWTVMDTSNIQLVADIPKGGSGYSILVHPTWLPTWPIGIIYQTIPAIPGTHRYFVSVFGKKSGISGGIRIGLKQAQGIDWKSGITVIDTVWTFYSTTDTIRASLGDSIIVAIATGACEVCNGSTYLNSCKFIKLDLL
jgi:hypothetical protein